LGILIDEKLNFNYHTENLEIKVSRFVEIFSKLKYYLPESALLKLYYSMVHSHLNYGFAILGKAAFTDLRNLMRNLSTFSLLVYFILLLVRKVSYIGER